MAKLNADVSNIEPSAPRDYPQIPRGWYIAMIVGSDIKPTKSGTGEYLELKFLIQDGVETDAEPSQHLNRNVWARLNIKNANQQTVEIAYRDLAAIGHAVGVTQIADSEQLHGKPLEILVEESEYNGKPSNEVTGYRPCQSAATPPPSGQAAQPAAAQAGSVPPWQA